MRAAFAKTLLGLAEKNPDIFLLTGDLGFSVFEEFKARFPLRYLNCGVAEQNMLGMAAGMALEGKTVFVYSIIPFLLYRGLEQIRNDMCYQRLPVKLAGVGSGLAYGTAGGSHHAVEDIGVMTSLPDMAVFAPGDPLEAARLTEFSLSLETPCYIRLNKAGDAVVHTTETIAALEPGKPAKVFGGASRNVIFAVGNMVPEAVETAKLLKSRGREFSVYSVHTLKPLDEESIAGILRSSAVVATIEEHAARNGLFSAIAGVAAKNCIRAAIYASALPDSYSHEVGSRQYLRRLYRLDRDSLAEKLYAVKEGG
ncbi:MAG: transketolase C-terminal domain-containing protein [Elusimicrobiales bacterium]|nr:transketolase C-terminal domain-containing protein [Elusimicrobiales bacterium]